MKKTIEKTVRLENLKRDSIKMIVTNRRGHQLLLPDMRGVGDNIKKMKRNGYFIINNLTFEIPHRTNYQGEERRAY